MTASAYQVAPLSGSRRLTDFIRVPDAVYTDDEHWVAPLDFERREALSAKHPFNLHAQWQGWVAYRDGQPVANRRRRRHTI